MTAFAPTTPAPSDLEAVILDYNGVIGIQPGDPQWRGLAHLAGWAPDDLGKFRTAFWNRREDYDEGTITSQQFWSGLLQGRTAPAGSALLNDLVRTDVAMWTATDPAVIDVLRAAHAGGSRLILLSNAPLPLANALDSSAWCATLFSRSVYSARIAANKPAGRAYEAALAAAGWPRPDRTLFVDDRLDNVQAAARLGLRTLHYTGDPAELAQHLPQPAAIAASSAP